MKDDNSWSHNVVSRPTREIVKLFEISDTTFSEDLKAVQNAAKTILDKRGAFSEIDLLNKCVKCLIKWLKDVEEFIDT